MRPEISPAVSPAATPARGTTCGAHPPPRRQPAAHARRPPTACGRHGPPPAGSPAAHARRPKGIESGADRWRDSGSVRPSNACCPRGPDSKNKPTEEVLPPTRMRRSTAFDASEADLLRARGRVCTSKDVEASTISNLHRNAPAPAPEASLSRLAGADGRRSGAQRSGSRDARQTAQAAAVPVEPRRGRRGLEKRSVSAPDFRGPEGAASLGHGKTDRVRSFVKGVLAGKNTSRRRWKLLDLHGLLRELVPSASDERLAQRRASPSRRSCPLVVRRLAVTWN